jgi:hypothetical protein
LEFSSPSRRIFIGSHSLPPSLVRRIGPSEAGLEEDEPEETHWDKGTQTEDVILEQDLTPKKCHIQTEEESP